MIDAIQMLLAAIAGGAISGILAMIAVDRLITDRHDPIGSAVFTLLSGAAVFAAVFLALLVWG